MIISIFTETNGKNEESKYLKIYNAYTNSYKKILQLSILYLGKTLPIYVSAGRSFFFSQNRWKILFFIKCLHTIYVEGTHTKTLNFESGPSSDNNLESDKVTRGHRNLRSWPKKIPEILLSWPFNFFIYVNTNLYQKYQKMTRNIRKISVGFFFKFLSNFNFRGLNENF